jgi:hypothetical protein
MSTQTPRSLTQLLAQMPDNTAGDISAQDMRDAMVSLYPSRGALQLVSTPVATTFASVGVYTKIAAATLIDASVCTSCVQMPADGELRFLKPVDQVLLVNATVAVLPAGNNKQYSFTFAKNGTAIDSLHVSRFFGNLGGVPLSLFFSGLVAITSNDVISLVVRNDTDTTAITASVLSLSGIGFIK